MDTGTPKDEVAVEIQASAAAPASQVELSTATGLRYRTVSRTASGKPKSRVLEPRTPVQQNKSPSNGVPVAENTSNTPLMAPPGGSPFEEDDDEEDDANDDAGVYKARPSDFQNGKRRKKVKVWVIIEWIVFALLLSLLISSLLVNYLHNLRIWSLSLWRWCVLALVIFCGHIFTECLISVAVILIERVFLLKKNVLYFLFAMKDSIQVVFWLASILVAWGLIIQGGVRRSALSSRILNYITRAVVSTLVASVIWAVKTFAVKLVATRFHVRTYFDRIQESVFHQYILQALSKIVNETGHISFRRRGKGSKEQVINVDKLYRMKGDHVSSWTMGGLIQLIRHSGLPSLSLTDTVEEEEEEEEEEEKEQRMSSTATKDIETEAEAIKSANKIFKKLARPGSKHIEAVDLLAYMPKEEVDAAIPLFEGAAETGRIKKSSFRNFVIKAYKERKFLAYSLNDSKTAIEELSKIASALVLVVIIIVWLLLMEITTTRVLIFILSQILLGTFIFGNSAKTLFESLVFVFVVHPFDVGDRCVINEVTMTVDEMNIMTTIFLKSDNEKVYYPNSELAKLPIGNFNRSPEMMGDSVEFAVDFSTPLSTLTALKEQIKRYIESKPKHWSPGHSVHINQIVDVDKMVLGLYLTHTINFQNSERGSRKSELILELKRIMEELGIKYRLLPQEVHVKHLDAQRT